MMQGVQSNPATVFISSEDKNIEALTYITNYFLKFPQLVLAFGVFYHPSKTSGGDWLNSKDTACIIQNQEYNYCLK